VFDRPVGNTFLKFMWNVFQFSFGYLDQMLKFEHLSSLLVSRKVIFNANWKVNVVHP